MDHRRRLVGGLMLAAFACYGAGSALGDRPLGQVLILLNSAVVGGIGVLLWQEARPIARRAAGMYLVGRLAEAVLLGAAALAVAGWDHDTGYQLGMLALGVASAPLWLALARHGWLPRWLGLWGAGGYALLAGGAVLELVGIPVGLVASVPGGLFEVVVALHLLMRRASAIAVSAPRGAGPRPTRATAATAGLGILAMAIIAAWANFGVIEAATPPGLAALRAAAGAFAVVAVLDVVVAWALWAVFADDHPLASWMTAWLRTAYAVVLAGGSWHLARGDVDTFDAMWSWGLFVFGLHLVGVGWLALWRGPVPRWIGGLVVVAGLGYAFDSLGRAWDLPEVSGVTFVGEVVLMVWLLVRAVRPADGPLQQPPATPASVGHGEPGPPVRGGLDLVHQRDGVVLGRDGVAGR